MGLEDVEELIKSVLERDRLTRAALPFNAFGSLGFLSSPPGLAGYISHPRGATQLGEPLTAEILKSISELMYQVNR
jgi:hypothetical protein